MESIFQLHLVKVVFTYILDNQLNYVLLYY